MRKDGIKLISTPPPLKKKENAYANINELSRSVENCEIYYLKEERPLDCTLRSLLCKLISFIVFCFIIIFFGSSLIKKGTYEIVNSLPIVFQITCVQLIFFRCYLYLRKASEIFVPAKRRWFGKEK